MAARLIGEHDFTTFSAAGDRSDSRVRHVYASCFYYEHPFLVYKIAANAFLWRMIRSLVGTLLELEARGSGAEELEAILASRDRERAGTTAPAWGLWLTKVLYYGERNLIS